MKVVKNKAAVSWFVPLLIIYPACFVLCAWLITWKLIPILILFGWAMRLEDRAFNK